MNLSIQEIGILFTIIIGIGTIIWNAADRIITIFSNRGKRHADETVVWTEAAKANVTDALRLKDEAMELKKQWEREAESLRAVADRLNVRLENIEKDNKKLLSENRRLIADNKALLAQNNKLLREVEELKARIDELEEFITRGHGE